jgi:hypothetical protein
VSQGHVLIAYPIANDVLRTTPASRPVARPGRGEPRSRAQTWRVSQGHVLIAYPIANDVLRTTPASRPVARPGRGEPRTRARTWRVSQGRVRIAHPVIRNVRATASRRVARTGPGGLQWIVAPGCVTQVRANSCQHVSPVPPPGHPQMARDQAETPNPILTRDHLPHPVPAP